MAKKSAKKASKKPAPKSPTTAKGGARRTPRARAAKDVFGFSTAAWISGAEFGDARAMQRVWTNLLDNAIKYTAGRQPAIIDVGAREQLSIVAVGVNLWRRRIPSGKMARRRGI